jgi:hypothetical protein
LIVRQRQCGRAILARHFLQFFLTGVCLHGILIVPMWRSVKILSVGSVLEYDIFTQLHSNFRANGAV